ncbi:Holliday junction DNA helicase subunit RuvB [Thermosporothrix hazakensis]|jgi:Holliday junction DNA helicase RuvB|uniref:Holliday junction branch migration complex subunit RuvB n=2 Tax=Thermosporothrix TaxID=768650 RepID=A0A326U2J6_THEHA|nr:Holliday junction branch migration DNA helicase RuvB [Thermosporothrix hazakensis]PZW24243.1 Holliday junction DNA helicase subunit RuvB [Thermosporothrix hazakensis]BBH89688.1 Holliday junction ATP-dependent DNA helicase RuvB [Thermosporothrix sp. COM3]GCE47874.1 Holliday junction ATP-dependent DNA helicase RuvB [Thermosporothrix hazakensis]
MDDRLVSPHLTDDEQFIEGSLRPRHLEEYIGQEKIKENLNILLEAARRRNEPVDHILLYGPPGLGKTTLCNIIAAEMGVNLRTTSGPAIEHAGDLASILTSLQPGEVLFIDEIHRLARAVEERLYSAMEDFAIDVVIGKGPGARSLRLSLPRFTVVGATTRVGSLTAPLRDRFGAIYRLEYYDAEALKQILLRSASILKVPAEEDGISEIARRARGTPRIVNRLLKRVRDYAQVKANGTITKEVAQKALDALEVDELGLDQTDRNMLLTIIKKFNGGPVGLDTLAASTSEDAETIEDVYEPYLLQLGFIARTPRGRVAMRAAYEHLKIHPPETEGRSTLWTTT